MKKMLIINASPRKDGVSIEIEKQVKAYFTDTEIIRYNAFELNPSPCDACGFCETNIGCSKGDLKDFYLDFEDSDYVVIFTPVYNNFFPSPMKAILDRFQRYYSARFSQEIKPPIEKSKRVGVVICSGSNCKNVADYMMSTLKQSFSVLNGELVARYYIPSTDVGRYSFNIIELEKFVHMLKN